jgi:hypothetical protein
MAQAAPDAWAVPFLPTIPTKPASPPDNAIFSLSLAAAHGRFVRQRYAKQYLQRLPHGWNTCIADSLRRLEHGLLQLPVWFGQREQTIGSARQIQFSVRLVF